MENIHIRRCESNDLDSLVRLSKQTFFEAFAQSVSQDDINLYLERSFATEQISTELTNPDSIFFIAWRDEIAIGYLKLNTGFAQTERLDSSALEVERIYVAGSEQSSGIGQLLLEKAVEIAISRKHSFIWLGVWESNHRAIKFYERNGFIPFDKHKFMMGNEEQTDIMFKKDVTGFTG